MSADRALDEVAPRTILLETRIEAHSMSRPSPESKVAVRYGTRVRDAAVCNVQ